MRIRIIQVIKDGETRLMPGEVLDIEADKSAAWVEAGMAIAFPEESDQPKKKSKAVTNGNG